MPLPTSGQLPDIGIIGEIPRKVSNSELLFNTVIPAEGISLRNGFHQDRLLQYYDLDYCRGNPSCSNSLNSLSVGREYILVTANNQPLKSQLPILAQESERPSRQPFRRVYRVTVPDGYQANSIRSEADIFASQFRIEATNQVLNHPIVAVSQGSLNLPIHQAWFQNQETIYIDFGSVPYSVNRDQLGTGIVYVMRNRDRSELPSRPSPIFDTVPGELLYSPIRQVFRAIAENFVTRPENDLALQIRSQDALLAAVNRGEFVLEDTRTFFNYPMNAQGVVTPQPTPSPSVVPRIYHLRLNPILSLPRLESPAHYGLWGTTAKGENRLLGRFRLSESGFTILSSAASPETFLIPASELTDVKEWRVTIESGQQTTMGSLLLYGTWNQTLKIQLDVPFASAYQQLNPGYYMLLQPGSEQAENGLWFVNRTNAEKTRPTTNELKAGLSLPPLPPGWVYNGWIRTGFRPLLWLPTGFFMDMNGADQQQRFFGGAGIPFPGEVFVRNAPEGLPFPFNIPSTGESAVVVSLEPTGIIRNQPLYTLYEADIAKGTTVYVPQKMNTSTPVWPRLELVLTIASER